MGICPFVGCRHARHRFNAVNYYGFLFGDKKQAHWFTSHKDNPAVAILIKRFEAIKQHSSITESDLIERNLPNPLTSEWMAEHADEVGEDGMRSLGTESMEDLFMPSDISTNLARALWVGATKESYKQLLVQRATEREATAEQVTGDSRARAAAAMGVDPADLDGRDDEVE